MTKKITSPNTMETFDNYLNNMLNNENTKIKRGKSEKIKSRINIKFNSNNVINDNINAPYSSKQSFEFLFFYNDEDYNNEDFILQNQYILFNMFLSKQNILDEIGYKSIISEYRLLFYHPIKQKDKIKEEIDKLIDYDEKLYEKYKDSKKEFDKIKIKNAIKNIIYLCSKISEILNEEKKINFYIDKMRIYGQILGN